MNTKLFILTIIFTIFCINTVNTLDFSALKCVDEDNSKAFTRGDKVYFCIHFIEEQTGFAKRISYLIEVDKYIALNLDDSFQYWYTQRQSTNANYQVVVQAQNGKTGTSPLIQYLGEFNGKEVVFPLNNAVITIDQGLITQVEWDNGCFTTQECNNSLSTIDKDGKSDTYKNNSVLAKDCTIDTEGASVQPCGLQIYVSWLGTDKDGNYMTSAGLRMSRFANYNGAEMWANSQKYFK